MDSPGLAHWQRAADGARIPAAMLAQMRAHPRFAEAMRQSAVGSLALFESDAVAMRALKDVGRIVIAIMALSLAARDELTLSRIQAFTEKMGSSSRGRAAAILLQLRLLRYIERAEAQDDRRVRLFRPTERMDRAFRAIFRNELAALVLLEPEVAPVLARFDEPAMFNPFIVRFAQGLIDAAKVHDRSKPGLELFSQRNGGLTILTALLLAGDPGDGFPPTGPIRFSVAGLARRFKVSRPHVLKILREAEKAGFLARDAEDGVGVLTPLLRELAADFYATSFIGYAVSAASAVRAQHTADAREPVRPQAGQSA